MNALAPVAPKLAPLLRLLSSDRDGEVLAAARMIGRVLTGAGLDWHALADAITAPPATADAPRPRPASPPPFYTPTHAAQVRAILAARTPLSAREADFVRNLWDKVCGGAVLRLSDKQAAWLEAIFLRSRSEAAA